MTRVHPIAALGLALLAGACGRSPIAYGGASSVIVTAADSVWADVEEVVLTTLEPRIQTVRDERAFELTYAPPGTGEWGHLRQWRQVLVIGRESDAWVSPVLAQIGGPTPQPPALLEAPDVWARGQNVMVILLGEDAHAATVNRFLPELLDRLDLRFRAYVRERMYVSGEDSALREALAETAGFDLILPQVYRSVMADSVFVFRNDHPTPGRLQRSVLVTWRTGVSEPVTAEGVLAWRERVGRTEYRPAQVSQPEPVVERPLTVFPSPALEVQGVWSAAPGEWIAAGPFISRVVTCPDQDRTYFLDAWLFAPREPKYEYMLQLQTILDTFQCARPGRLAG